MRTVLLFLALAASGCSLVESEVSRTLTDDVRLTVATERTRYVLHPDSLYLTIRYTVTNTGDADVYIVGSGDFNLLDKQMEGEWRGVYSGVFEAILRPPIVLKPGETLDGSFRLWPSDLTGPQWTGGDVPGTYRLPIHNAHSTWDRENARGELLPKEARVSNAFEVVR